MQSMHNNGNGTYTLSASLVHRAIMACIGGIVTIAGYMVVWAVQDARGSGELEIRLVQLEREVAALRAAQALGSLPLSRERLNALESRISKLEHKHEARVP